MTQKQNLGPVCGKCQNRMQWVSEQIADAQPMQVFHCETCDKYAAALSGINHAKGAGAQPRVTGL